MIKNIADKIFRRASSTYYYASTFFPPKAKEDIFTLYAYVRIADDFVDSIPAKKKEFLLLKSQTALAFKNKPVSNPIISDFVDLSVRTGIKQAWVDSFLAAMEADLHKKHYTNIKQLDQYIYGSAEVIGLMMAQILQLPTASHETARLQGKAMQLVNMIRDIQEDHQLQRRYLPGVPSLPITEKNKEVFNKKMHEYLSLYQSIQKQAEGGWKYLPIRSRIAVRTAAYMYNWSANKIAQDPSVVLQGKVKPANWYVFINGLYISLLEIAQISRPRFWLYLAGPFVVGWAAATSGVASFLHPSFWMIWLYFFLPANWILYLINDISDEDTDKFNLKKQIQEVAMTRSDRQIYIAIIILSALFAVILPYTTLINKISVLLFFILAIAYSLPPLRLKKRPFLDMFSNTLYILPGIYAYTLHTSLMPNLFLILSAAMWSWAMQLFSAIPDIVPDTKANLQTTAIFLGEHTSLIVCSLLWLGSGVVAATQHLWFVLLGLYCLIPVFVIQKRINIKHAYWRFPIINTGVGFGIFLYALFT